MNWFQLTSHLDPGQEIAIMTHDKPDGDAWGSVLGLGLVLENLGYRPKFIHAGLQPGRMYSWLPGQHLIQRTASEGFSLPEREQVIVLDCGDLGRCEFAIDESQVLLNVDHHVSNPGFGQIGWIDATAGATAQILCRLLLENDIVIPPEAATNFYIALVTDTGNFRFSNTGAETLRIAAVLVEHGADIPSIRQRLWENRPGQELPLLQEMMKSMVLFAEGQAALCFLPYDLVMATGIHDAETDTALEAIRSVEGIEAVVLLKEAEPGLVKVSLRSKERIDSASFMSGLGGGGHLRAAGATLRESLPEVREKVIRLLSEALESR